MSSLISISALSAALVNRYSFNDAAGPANAGTPITDSANAADGVIIGNGAIFTGSAINLPGGAGGSTAAYVDLPNGLLSTHNTVTFEAWFTVETTTDAWGRVWDFGSSAGGEVPGSGGGGEGQDYFMYAPMQGTDINLQRNALRNLDPLTLGTGTAPVNGAEIDNDPNLPSALGVEYHIATVWEPAGAGGTMTTYRDGVLVGGPTPTNYNATDMNDVNNWLGRSNWTGDGYLDGEINEFRIYDSALTATQVAASFDAGADNPPDFGLDEDGDGMPDLYEDGYAFLDRTDPDDADLDEDSDGLTNLEEYQANTRPDIADTDMDTLLDGEEINTYGTNPVAADTDSDALDDGDELNTFNTDPNDPDSDDDGIPDGYETTYAFLDPNVPGDAANDEEPDGLTNLEEFNAGTVPNIADTDSDTLSDGDEINLHGTNPLLPDSDGDTLADADEVNTFGTSPILVDTDGDGNNDAPEIAEGIDPLVADATKPEALHRYSFNAPAGAAGAGTLIADAIGGADGVIVGANGQWTGMALTLPGGDGATADAAYVDLPNGLMSSLDHLTFEAWYTIRTEQAWGRIWDFGSTLGGEVSAGMTGNTEGQDYFMFAPNQGTNVNVQRYTVRNLDPLAPGGGVGPVDGDEEPLDTALATALGQEYHVAGVWTSDSVGGAQLILYRDGVREGSRTTTFTPRDVNDVNNWLGRSNWTGDAYLNGDLNEFRIYEGSMNDAAAAASFAAGPDAAIASATFRITEILYDQGNDQFTLTWTSKANRLYSLYWDTDLRTLDQELDDGIPATDELTSFGPFPNPSPGATRIFFRVVENPPAP